MARANPRPSAEMMLRTLESEYPGTTEKPIAIPSARTIRDLVAGMNFADQAGLWSLATAELDSIPYVLPVLAAVAEATKGNVSQLTNDEADLIARIRRGAGDLPLVDAYNVAKLYLIRQTRKAPTDDLDQFLSWAPWRDAADERYARAVKDGWISGDLHYVEGKLHLGRPGRVLRITIGDGGVASTTVHQAREEHQPKKRIPRRRRNGAN